MKSTVLQQPVVDALGNIVLHARSGLSLVLSFEDGAGAPRNVSSAPIFFEVQGLFRTPLEAGSAPDQRLLLLSDEQAGQIFDRKAGCLFAFRDESGSEPDVFWSGTIRATGFKEQPQ